MKLIKRVAMAISLVASALTFVEACYLTSDFSGIADGTRPPAEGGGDDAQVVDAGTPASDSGDAGPFSCANTSYAVCTTFDDMGALASGGWKVQMLGSGQASLDPSQFVSPPNSFRSLVPANSTTQHWSAIIFQPVMVPTTYTTLTYAFDFRLTTCTSSGSGMTVMAINPNPQHTLGMLITKSGLEWGEAVADGDGGSVFNPATLGKQPVSGVWMRITTIIKNPANPTIDILYDDKPVLSAHPFTPFTPASQILLNLGNNGSGPNSNCDIAYDNVVFDRQ
jgi:hypothetical protein